MLHIEVPLNAGWALPLSLTGDSVIQNQAVPIFRKSVSAVETRPGKSAFVTRFPLLFEIELLCQSNRTL